MRKIAKSVILQNTLNALGRKPQWFSRKSLISRFFQHKVRQKSQKILKISWEIFVFALSVIPAMNFVSKLIVLRNICSSPHVFHVFSLWNIKNERGWLRYFVKRSCSPVKSVIFTLKIQVRYLKVSLPVSYWYNKSETWSKNFQCLTCKTSLILEVFASSI